MCICTLFTNIIVQQCESRIKTNPIERLSFHYSLYIQGVPSETITSLVDNFFLDYNKPNYNEPNLDTKIDKNVATF